jgi:hypothetical protein
MVGYNGEDQSTEINLAVWMLIGASTLFLVARLWCRQHFAKIWWDDVVLCVSWVCPPLALAAAVAIHR